MPDYTPFKWAFIVFEWMTFALWIIMNVKYVARKSQIKPFNRLMRKMHIPLGILLLSTMLTHMIMAFVGYPTAIAENVTGVVLVLMFMAITLTFVFRKKLKKNWFPAHRYLSFSSIIILVLHIVFANINY